jgi:bacteriocin-like protein
MEEYKKKNIEELNENELDTVTGGGFLSPISKIFKYFMKKKYNK